MIRTLGLGTRLRLLLNALDESVEQIYRDADLPFRARFYPFFQLLMERESASVGECAIALGFTQPAATQTLRVMADAGLLARVESADRRERRYRLSAAAMEMLPRLRAIWDATEAAAARLEAELDLPIGAATDGALAYLAKKSFAEIIQEEMT